MRSEDVTTTCKINGRADLPDQGDLARRAPADLAPHPGPDDCTLAELHWIIQGVMGWDDDHMHAFSLGGLEYGQPDPYLDMRDDTSVKLSQLHLEPKSRFRYKYDFGDSWEHDLLVEKILPPEPGVAYPRCLTGRLACPPEDVGGIWGYIGFLEAIQDPANPAHEEYLEWIGGEFDPEAFDLEAVNRALSAA